MSWEKEERGGILKVSDSRALKWHHNAITEQTEKIWKNLFRVNYKEEQNQVKTFYFCLFFVFAVF